VRSRSSTDGVTLKLPDVLKPLPQSAQWATAIGHRCRALDAIRRRSNTTGFGTASLALCETCRPVLDERDSACAGIGRGLDDEKALPVRSDVEHGGPFVRHRGGEQWLRNSDG
jgi:hypothetical protein